MDDERDYILAFTWYLRRDYERLKDLVEDDDSLFDTYDEWLVDARRALVEFKRQGFVPKRVLIRVDEYVAWCEAREKPIDASSRETYKEIRRQQFYRAIDRGVDPKEFFEGDR